MNRLPKKAGPPARAPAAARNLTDGAWGHSPEGKFVSADRTRLPAEPEPLLRLLRFAEVRRRTGLSRTTIWRLERSGEFPRHRRISANAVAWVEQEISIWIRSKIDTVLG